jgi:dUTP pyrophosphatase
MLPPIQYYLDPEASSVGCSFQAPREGDAGFDLYCARPVSIEPGAQSLVETGLYVAIPQGWVGIIKDRSSVALSLARTHAGVIDAGYRGHVKVIISNAGPDPLVFAAGQKFAQMIVVPHLSAAEAVSSIEDLGSSERGEGGFGSTGCS